MSNTTKSFRFTHNSGSKLLYYGDEFAAKFSSRHASAMLALLSANELMREEIDKFTTHVGAASFQEAVEVTFRSMEQNGNAHEECFSKLKETARKRNELASALDDLLVWANIPDGGSKYSVILRDAARAALSNNEPQRGHGISSDPEREIGGAL